MTVTEGWQQLMIALVDSHDLDGKCDRVRELMGHIRTRKEEMARSVCNLHVLYCSVCSVLLCCLSPMCGQNHYACIISFSTNCNGIDNVSQLALQAGSLYLQVSCTMY